MKKLGLMAAILGMTAALFGGRREAKPAKRIGETSAGGWNPQAIYVPRRTKFKGYMRDNRNWGKKRKAA